MEDMLDVQGGQDMQDMEHVQDARDMEDMQDMGAVVMAGVVTSRMKPSLRNQPQL